jgi:hypothetical protein
MRQPVDVKELAKTSKHNGEHPERAKKVQDERGIGVRSEKTGADEWTGTADLPMMSYRRVLPLHHVSLLQQ